MSGPKTNTHCLQLGICVQNGSAGVEIMLGGMALDLKLCYAAQMHSAKADIEHCIADHNFNPSVAPPITIFVPALQFAILDKYPQLSWGKTHLRVRKCA